jgi:hypothetical protein
MHDDLKKQVNKDIKDTDKSMIRQIRRTPLVLQGLFLEVVQALYSDEAGLYEHVKPWKSAQNVGTEKENHNLFIDVSANWSDSSNDRRPAIFVDIGPLQSKPIKGAFGSAANMDMEEGLKTYSRLVAGSVVFACLSSKQAEAMLYGSQTYDLLDGFGPVIQEDFCFEQFDVTSISKTRQRKDEPRDWESLVQVNFEFQETFSVKRESPKLKQITIKSTAGISQNTNSVS